MARRSLPCPPRSWASCSRQTSSSSGACLPASLHLPLAHVTLVVRRLPPCVPHRYAPDVLLFCLPRSDEWIVFESVKQWLAAQQDADLRITITLDCELLSIVRNDTMAAATNKSDR